VARADRGVPGGAPNHRAPHLSRQGYDQDLPSLLTRTRMSSTCDLPSSLPVLRRTNMSRKRWGS
jgi:hypothetical protein